MYEQQRRKIIEQYSLYGMPPRFTNSAINPSILLKEEH